MKHNIIVAVCNGNGIGHSNKLPWYYKEELQNFSKATKGNGNNAIIMGKNTYDSIKTTLKNRDTYILSNSFTIDSNINNNIIIILIYFYLELFNRKITLIINSSK